MDKKTIWILLDNRIGSRHQAQGIADYLDESKFLIINKEVKYTRWAALPNIIRANTLLGVENKADFTKPWPDIVLSSSRRTAPVARFVKKNSCKTKLVQLLHIGRFGVKDFETIYAPEHDKYKYSAPNIKYTIGSPHFVTKKKLAEAREYWNQTFSSLPHPITAIIIGGSIKKKEFSIENAESLARAVLDLKQREGGSLLVTTSRRTGLNAQNVIMSHFKDISHSAYLWGDEGENPYLGYLACADDLVVTGDSVSMCCEATATGKPLRIFTGKNWLTPKHLRFVQTLIERGLAVDLLDKKPVFSDMDALNVAKQIADDINCF